MAAYDHYLHSYLARFNIFFLIDFAKTDEEEFKIPPQLKNTHDICWLVHATTEQDVPSLDNCTSINDLNFTLGTLYSRLSTQVVLFTERHEEMGKKARNLQI